MPKKFSPEFKTRALELIEDEDPGRAVLRPRRLHRRG